MWLHSQRTALPQHSSFGPRPHLQGIRNPHTPLCASVFTTPPPMRCDALQVLLPPEQAERLRDQLIQDVSGPDVASRLAGALQTTHIVPLLLLFARSLVGWRHGASWTTRCSWVSTGASLTSMTRVCRWYCSAWFGAWRAVPHPPPLMLRCLLAGHVGTREAACSGRSEQEEACASTG